ncbi:hypothetical protein EI94DRAFT_1753921 [Lactarius quietus]|nr:hypothetical protein EI94DRAFT_1753921 [Lactarius quietus]
MGILSRSHSLAFLPSDTHPSRSNVSPANRRSIQSLDALGTVAAADADTRPFSSPEAEKNPGAQRSQRALMRSSACA